jgi:hypothetical protein
VNLVKGKTDWKMRKLIVEREKQRRPEKSAEARMRRKLIEH